MYVTVSVLDINQSLIDDNLVEKEKIGGSNYFWSFPAKKDRLVQLQYQKTVDEIEQLKAILADANHKLLDAKRGREDDNDDASNDNLNDGDGNDDIAKNLDENDASGNGNSNDENIPPPKKQKTTSTMNRAMKLQRLEEIRAEKMAIDKEMNELKENDPQLIANLQKEYKLVQEAANRWTDNIFNCKSYLIKKRNMDKKDANKILGITDSFDCKYRSCCYASVKDDEIVYTIVGCFVA